MCRGVVFMGKKKSNSITFSNRKLLAVILVYLIGIALSSACCWALVCCVARIMCSADLDASLHVPMATGCCAAGILLISLLYTRKIGLHGILWGALLALGTWCVFTLLGILHGNSFTTLTLLRISAYICCGMLGGVTGMLLHERGKKRRI